MNKSNSRADLTKGLQEELVPFRLRIITGRHNQAVLNFRAMKVIMEAFLGKRLDRNPFLLEHVKFPHSCLGVKGRTRIQQLERKPFY